MSFKPKQFYSQPQPPEAEPEVGETFNVYHRNADNSLGLSQVSDCASHKEAILTVKEALVAEGDGLSNKAVLVAIKGGKE